MFRHKVRLTPSCKGKRVDEEEAEDDHNRAKYAPPQLLVHHGLRLLFSADQVLHGGTEGIEGPDVEGC